MSETVYVVLTGDTDTDEESVEEVYYDGHVAAHNALYEFRPDVREQVRERLEEGEIDLRDAERVEAYPDQDRTMYVRIEEAEYKR